MKRAGNMRSSRGFTLVELLLVMAIIAILIAILVPAIKIGSQDQVAASAVIKSLQNALDSYYVTYNAYPPSQVPADYPNAGGITTGAEALYYFLFGPRGQGWGPHTLDGGIKGKDQNFKADTKGIRADWVSRDENAPRYFIDGMGDDGKAILYYRPAMKPKTDGVKDVYVKAHNAKFWNPAENVWRRYMEDPSYPGTAANRNTYILIAPGNDREYGYQEGTPVTDDVTNFRGS